MMEKKGDYLRILGYDYRHIYVIGDLHGYYVKLINKMAEVEFDPAQDLLISVGDLIDRGDKNIECLELLNNPWFKAVMGNHEAMALESLAYPKTDLERRWYHNGGDWFWELSGEERFRAHTLLKRTVHLPLVIELNITGKTFVIAHADYPYNEYEFGKSLRGKDTLWSRQRYMALRNGTDPGIKGPDGFYFGHTPDKEVIDIGNIHFIDTGAGLGGELTMVKLK